MISVPRSELAQLLPQVGSDVSAADRDEMAIPSYLHANPLVRWLMWRRYAAIESLMDVRLDQSVLEFGCGAGLFLPSLCMRYPSVLAIDLFPHFATLLVENRRLDVTFIDSVEVIPAQSLGAIVAADVLEHVDDLDYYLELFCAKLRPNGQLLVSGPTESIPYRIGRSLAGFGGKGHYHHRSVGDIADRARRLFSCEGRVSLPFRFAPHLFEVLNFTPRATHYAAPRPESST